MKNIPKIEDIGKRFLKFKLKDGRFPIRFFNNERKLWRYIQENKDEITDCYISLNNFLNPKDTDKSDNPIVTKKRTIIDLDDVTKKNVLEVLKLLKENNLKYEYILQTSKNSIQILLNENKDNYIKELFEKNNIDFCPTTLNDIKRVYRIPISIHHSGFKSRLLNKDLKGFDGIPLSKIKEEKQKHEFFFKFLRQRVSGIRKNDRSVLYYKSDILNLSKVRYLQQRFNLNDCYILLYENDAQKWGYLYPKAIQVSQLKKIQKSQYFIRISKKRNGNKIISPQPKLYKVIKSKVNKGPISFTHMNWLRKKMGVKKVYPIEIGKEDKGQIGWWKG